MTDAELIKHRTKKSVINANQRLDHCPTNKVPPCKIMGWLMKGENTRSIYFGSRMLPLKKSKVRNEHGKQWNELDYLPRPTAVNN